LAEAGREQQWIMGALGQGNFDAFVGDLDLGRGV
jgi:hypothetical protein